LYFDFYRIRFLIEIVSEIARLAHFGDVNLAHRVLYECRLFCVHERCGAFLDSRKLGLFFIPEKLIAGKEVLALGGK
jgi:hypothetical protein